MRGAKGIFVFLIILLILLFLRRFILQTDDARYSFSRRFTRFADARIGGASVNSG